MKFMGAVGIRLRHMHSGVRRAAAKAGLKAGLKQMAVCHLNPRMPRRLAPADFPKPPDGVDVLFCDKINTKWVDGLQVTW